VEKAGLVVPSEPVWVRTRVGDLLINGPSVLGPGLPSAEQPGVGSVVGQLSSDSIESFGCDPIQQGGAINNLVPQQQRVIDKQKGGKKKKKKNPKRNIPNLPYNMLRKLPGGLPTKKAGTSKKRDDGEEGLSDVAELSEIP
jgi:hypothetical protein